MRETIEKKLGCTIEECLKKSIEMAYNGAEAEYPNPFLKLTREERKFVDDIISKAE